MFTIADHFTQLTDAAVNFAREKKKKKTREQNIVPFNRL